jgi:hypothetical protein
VTTAGAPGRGGLRLAELVAALSLGIDLGFGQPMEHVLRQCIIALRLAERIGLADSERMVVYYTALLVNVDGTALSRHAELAGSLAEQLGLPDAVRVAVAASYEQWDGKGWPGLLKGDAAPIASRLAQLAEFVEVAHRLGGIAGAETLARRRSGSQFDPGLRSCCAAAPRRSSEVSTRPTRGRR